MIRAVSAALGRLAGRRPQARFCAVKTATAFQYEGVCSRRVWIETRDGNEMEMRWKKRRSEEK